MERKRGLRFGTGLAIGFAICLFSALVGIKAGLASCYIPAGGDREAYEWAATCDGVEECWFVECGPTIPPCDGTQWGEYCSFTNPQCGTCV